MEDVPIRWTAPRRYIRRPFHFYPLEEAIGREDYPYRIENDSYRREYPYYEKPSVCTWSEWVKWENWRWRLCSACGDVGTVMDKECANCWGEPSYNGIQGATPRRLYFWGSDYNEYLQSSEYQEYLEEKKKTAFYVLNVLLTLGKIVQERRQCAAYKEEYERAKTKVVLSLWKRRFCTMLIEEDRREIQCRHEQELEDFYTREARKKVTDTDRQGILHRTEYIHELQVGMGSADVARNILHCLRLKHAHVMNLGKK